METNGSVPARLYQEEKEEIFIVGLINTKVLEQMSEKYKIWINKFRFLVYK